MRLSPAATVAILLGVALTLPGCGDRRSAAVGTEMAQPRRAQERVAPSTRTCRGQLHDLLDSLDALRGNLAVGLSYAAYLREVRVAQAAYERIPVDRLGLGCLATAGTPVERALNRYIDAANTWGDCLALASCDSESVEPKLQRKWALASDQLSLAQKGLRDAAPG